MKKEKRPEALVGVFVLVGLLVLGALVVKFGRLGDGGMENKYTVTVIFKDASGLIKGSEVRMGGARIGKVITTPELTQDLVVQMKVVLDERVKIDKKSIFQIQSLSFVGDKMIVIIPPEKPSGEILHDGDVVRGGGAGGLDALQSDAASVARDARALMSSAKVTLAKVNHAIDQIDLVSKELAETLRRVNSGILDDGNLLRLKRSIKNIELTTASFKTISEEVKPTFAEIRTAIASMKKAADSADTLFAEAGGVVDSIKPAIAGIPETLASLRKASNKALVLMDNANVAVTKISKSKGLLKTLTQDKEFDRNTKKFVKNLKHYGILRYRDDDTYSPKDPKTSRYRSKRRR